MARVLLAIDGSEAAVSAARRAVELFGSEAEYVALTVVRASLVATTPTPVTSSMPGSLAVIEEEPEPDAVLAATARAETEANDDLEEALRPLHLDALRHVEVGDAGATICAVAAREHCDVIVLGSHGRGMAHRLLLGSVCEYVMRHASQLVLVAPRATAAVQTGS